MGVDTTQGSTSRIGLGRAAAWGAGAGLLASVVMAGYAMSAAWAKDIGFFTPLYHIASLFISPHNMGASMEAAMGGSDFHFAFGPAVLGAVIHMMTGAGYGAMFGLIVSRLPASRQLLVVAGVVWGALVFVVSTYVGLPIAAAIFNSGDQITHMAKMAGYGTFIIEHLVYGLVLGLLVAYRPTRVAQD